MSKDRPREREEWKPKIRSQSTSRNDKHVIHTTLKYIAGIEVFRILHKRTLYAGAQCRSVSCHFSAWHEWVFKEPEQKKRIIETWIMDIHVMYITSTNTIFFSYIYSHAGVCICKTEKKKKKYKINESNAEIYCQAKAIDVLWWQNIYVNTTRFYICLTHTKHKLHKCRVEDVTELCIGIIVTPFYAHSSIIIANRQYYVESTKLWFILFNSYFDDNKSVLWMSSHIYVVIATHHQLTTWW